MRFRSTSKKAPYLNRRDQRRLLYLVGLLLLVIVGMRVAAKPGTWSWLFIGGKKQSPTAATEKTTKTASPEKSPSPLRPDEFRATTSKTKTANGKTGKTKSSAKQAVGSNSVTDLPPGTFPPKMDDRELGVTEDEWQAYLAVLAHVKKVPVADLDKQARDDASFTLLKQTPEVFRGTPITIEGRLGSLRKIPPTKVDYGLGQLYEAWIVTPESENEPYRVVFFELPAGLEPTDLFDPPPHVRVTGYFFKMQKYEAKPNGAKYRYNYAPLLLARRIERTDDRRSDIRGLGLAPYVIGFALILGAVLAVTMWRFSRGDKQFAKEHLQRFEERTHEEAVGLNRHEASESPEEFFARLSQTEPAAAETVPEDTPRA